MATVNNAPPRPGQAGLPPQQPAAAPPRPPVAIPPQQTVVVPAQQAIVQTPGALRGPVQERHGEPVLRIYSHSNLVYWWPVWAIGFMMAALSFAQGRQYEVGDALEYFHPSSNLGIFWFVTLFLVILITNVPCRGLASGIVIMGIITVTVTFAYFGWWDTILRWLGNLSIHMNGGAYMFISTLLFVVWATSVFIFDHMSYWEITPGQVTRIRLFGAGQTSYEPENMVLEKYRNDVFRHWILGLGAGDMRIQTGSVNRQQLDIPNVLFVGYKVKALQRMIATKPTEPENMPHVSVRG
jgi:hypothetical protein